MVNPMREPLSGVVEVDEAYVGGPERGRRGIVGRSIKKKVPVVVAVENRGDHAGRVRMEILPDLTHEALSGFIGRNVAPGSQVNTDALPAYEGLDSLKYLHRPKVQKTANRAGKILPWVHQTIGNLKTWLRGTHHGRMTRQHLQEYLDEFTFRFNRRNYREHSFLSLLILALQIKPLRFIPGKAYASSA
jgi:transposase-like protein